MPFCRYGLKASFGHTVESQGFARSHPLRMADSPTWRFPVCLRRAATQYVPVSFASSPDERTDTRTDLQFEYITAAVQFLDGPGSPWG